MVAETRLSTLKEGVSVRLSMRLGYIIKDKVDAEIRV